MYKPSRLGNNNFGGVLMRKSQDFYKNSPETDFT